MSDKLFMTCGDTAKWVCGNLVDAGHETRRCAGITLDEPNGYDDGHVLLEVLIPDINKWVLFDVDNNAMFYNDEDEPLSVYELSDLINRGYEYRISYIASDPSINDYFDEEQKKQCNFTYAFYADRISGEKNLRKWYDRVMQVPLVCDESDGKYYFCDDRNIKGLENDYGYKYMPEDDFIIHFYQ